MSTCSSAAVAEVLDRERAAAQQWIEQTAAGQAWAAQRGISLPLRLPPTQACDANTPRPTAEISRPAPGSDVSGPVEIWGSGQRTELSAVIRWSMVWARIPAGGV